ncbi:BAH domain protein [Ceratobasidium sp. AG-Ba]|nr:BAH domain protein [Ceratobasidium sp. AG-Ba]
MLYANKEFMDWIDDDGREYEHLPPIFYAMLAEGVIEEKGGDEPIFPLHDQDEVGSICNIIWCAQTPIKRGCSAGVVGNEAIVKKARELLRGMWEEREGDSFGVYPEEDQIALFKAYDNPPKAKLFRCMYCNWPLPTPPVLSAVPMPPPKSARLPKGTEAQFAYENLGELDFEKKIQVFGIYGVERNELRLLNGDVVVKGDCVEIKQGYDHSNTSYDGERWFAEVVEIKGESYDAGYAEMYVLCNWFYSEASRFLFSFIVADSISSLPSQTLRCAESEFFRDRGESVRHLPSFGPTLTPKTICSTRCPFSHKELMLSDHKQVFAPENIIRKASIRFFDELDRKQPHIGDHEYWYRFNLRIGKGPMDTRVAQGKKRHLPPARCAIETCELGRYKPDEHIQILCPREGCEFWYHEQCLSARGFIVSSEKEIRNRLRNILHGTPEFVFMKDGCRENIPEEWYATFNSGILEERGGDEPLFPEYEKGSISNILWCAQRSIRRGGMNGIVGNEAVVTKARTLVREIIDYWSSNLWPSEEDTALFEEFQEPKDPTYYCVRCSSII